jgi:hypothetical protein
MPCLLLATACRCDSSKQRTAQSCKQASHEVYATCRKQQYVRVTRTVTLSAADFG